MLTFPKTGTALTDINAQLHAAAVATGYVLMPDDTPVDLAVITVRDSEGSIVFSGDSDATGRYATTGLPLGDYTVRTLGSSEEMFARLLPLILGGFKTGTFSLGEAPRVGAYVVVTHFDGTPALIWRITGVEIVPFDEIGARQLEAEGPGLREVGAWRQVHARAWAGQLAGKSRAEIGRTPVVVQRFEIIYPAASAQAH